MVHAIQGSALVEEQCITIEIGAPVHKYTRVHILCLSLLCLTGEHFKSNSVRLARLLLYIDSNSSQQVSTVLFASLRAIARVGLQNYGFQTEMRNLLGNFRIERTDRERDERLRTLRQPNNRLHCLYMLLHGARLACAPPRSIQVLLM